MRSLRQRDRAHADSAPPPDAGHDLALRQIPVTDQPLAAILS